MLPKEGSIDAQTGFYEMRVLRKGGKRQSIYVIPKLLEETIWYVLTQRPKAGIGAENYVFLNSNGAKVNKLLISRKFREAFDAIGANTTFHGLRHTFAVTVLQLLEEQAASGNGNNPLKTLQVLMGHASIETTDIYLRSLSVTSDAVEKALGFLYGYAEGSAL